MYVDVMWEVDGNGIKLISINYYVKDFCWVFYLE